MTTEEAVEVVLGGVVWRICDRCNATGLVDCEKGEVSPFSSGAMGRYMKKSCPVCDGSGFIVRPDYAEACRLLDRSIPQRGFKRIVDIDPIGAPKRNGSIYDP